MYIFQTIAVIFKLGQRIFGFSEIVLLNYMPIFRVRVGENIKITRVKLLFR